MEFEDALERQSRPGEEERLREKRATAERWSRQSTPIEGICCLAAYEEWVLGERDRLHQLYVYAAEQLVELLEQQRAYEGAIKGSTAVSAL